VSAVQRLRRVFIAAALVTAAEVGAHEVRPGYLALTETRSGRFDVVWKVPTRGGVPLAGDILPHASATSEPLDGGEQRTMPCGCPAPTALLAQSGALPIHAVLPAEWLMVAPPRLEQLPGAVIRRWTVLAGEPGIEGGIVAVHGLDAAAVDVLVRIARADGRVVSHVLRPGASSFTIETDVAIPVLGYVRLGVEHILFGIDHLLFVLGLVLLVGSVRSVVKIITAFTVAHSTTLGLATLGAVRVPQAPVEAAIALSIAVLASELVRQRRGETGWTARQPWLVAFVFGLLHGLGFAGALSDVGLPPGDVPAALLLFNVGVEAGQLAFVAAVLSMVRAVRLLPTSPGPRLGGVPAYAIGSIATFWLMQRVTGFWTHG
jgi:hydrogenase/urease accessory protein HupE